ncbi:MAG: gamma-glutamyl-gamma-aminobutyrate hydrolase family protein [Rhodospirillaceae bacterium]|nr:gamma-glutamyl-gamma-aminobutyrate hydrolase family protein [Rhodospirillaceae bacterium]
MSNNKAKPIIGISGCRMLVEKHEMDAAGHMYMRAVESVCRGIPLVVPTLGDALDRQALLGRIDGMIFTGSGSNVEPHHYDGPDSAPGTLHDAYRDATTLPLIRDTIDAGLPVLCICRGHQELNVAFGGSLHQRIFELADKIDHADDEDQPMAVRYGPAHAVTIVAGGILSGITGLAEARINSLHNQGIDRLGDGLTAEAHAPDGLIEAVSVAAAKRFAMGVQWHPEWDADDNPLSRALFQAFADGCRDVLRERQLY